MSLYHVHRAPQPPPTPRGTPPPPVPASLGSVHGLDAASGRSPPRAPPTPPEPPRRIRPPAPTRPTPPAPGRVHPQRLHRRAPSLPQRTRRPPAPHPPAPPPPPPTPPPPAHPTEPQHPPSIFTVPSRPPLGLTIHPRQPVPRPPQRLTAAPGVAPLHPRRPRRELTRSTSSAHWSRTPSAATAARYPRPDSTSALALARPAPTDPRAQLDSCATPRGPPASSVPLRDPRDALAELARVGLRLHHLVEPRARRRWRDGRPLVGHTEPCIPALELSRAPRNAPSPRRDPPGRSAAPSGAPARRRARCARRRSSLHRRVGVGGPLGEEGDPLAAREGGAAEREGLLVAARVPSPAPRRAWRRMPPKPPSSPARGVGEGRRRRRSARSHTGVDARCSRRGTARPRHPSRARPEEPPLPREGLIGLRRAAGRGPGR